MGPLEPFAIEVHRQWAALLAEHGHRPDPVSSRIVALIVKREAALRAELAEKFATLWGDVGTLARTLREVVEDLESANDEG